MRRPRFVHLPRKHQFWLHLKRYFSYERSGSGVCFQAVHMARFLQTITGLFLVLVFVLQPTSGADPCDKKCPTDSENRFQFPNQNRSDIVTWTAARDLCRQRGMTLPTIRSPCEQYLLTSYLQYMGVFEYDIWLGGKSKENHEWEWLNGSLLTNHSFASRKTGCRFGYIWMSPSVELGNDTSRVERKFICEFDNQKTCKKEQADILRHYETFPSSGNTSIKCYVPSKHASSWYNARTHCRRSGGDLAKSSDVIDSFSLYNATGNETFWVGLRQVKWNWENDEDVDMTFFRSTDVDRAENGSDCMSGLRGDQWIWDSRPCNDSKSNRLLVVCEKANQHQRMTTNCSLCSRSSDCSESSSSWQAGTVALIVITSLLLVTVFVLVLFLRRLSKAVAHEEQPNDVNDEENTRTRDIARLSIAVEEHKTSTLLTTQIVDKTEEANETTKKLAIVIPAKPDESYVQTLPQFPFVGHSATPDSATPYAVGIHHIEEYRRQISTFSSVRYQDARSIPPMQTDLAKKTNNPPVNLKPKPQTKKTNGPCEYPFKPYSNQTVYDVERPVSPSIHTANNEAPDNASVPSTTQHNPSKDSKGRALNEDAHSVTVQKTYSALDIRSREAVCYRNKEYDRIHQTTKYATDADGYLQPNYFEQASASSTRTGDSVYSNADELEPPSSQKYTKEGVKATAKRVGKLTAKLRGKLQKPRAPDPVSPTIFVSAFRKRSVTRSVSLDRSNSNERTSKASSHTYAEIISDDDDIFSSTNQPTVVQPTKKERSMTERTKKERTKLQKKLSAKNWSENEGAVGY